MMINNYDFSQGGGTGFVGTALKGLLTKNGYDVVTVSRMPGPNRISWVKTILKIWSHAIV